MSVEALQGMSDAEYLANRQAILDAIHR